MSEKSGCGNAPTAASTLSGICPAVAESATVLAFQLAHSTDPWERDAEDRKQQMRLAKQIGRYADSMFQETCHKLGINPREAVRFPLDSILAAQRRQRAIKKPAPGTPEAGLSK